MLLVGGKDEDAELVVMAFDGARSVNPLVRARDGVEALDYLFGRGKHAERDVSELPAVVLLDIKLPKLSGLEVLKAICADQRTKRLPIVLLTSSKQDPDPLPPYYHFANNFVFKPVDYHPF